MPVYRVQSGDLDVTHKTAYHADPLTIAALVIERHRPKALGLLIEIEGGHFVGTAVTYVSAEQVLQAIGQMEAA